MLHFSMEKKPTSLRMLESLFECEQPHIEDLLERSHEKAEHIAWRKAQNTERRASRKISAQAAQQEISELSR